MSGARKQCQVKHKQYKGCISINNPTLEGVRMREGELDVVIFGHLSLYISTKLLRIGL